MQIAFNWIIKDQLSGGSKPGWYNDIEKDLDYLKDNGISTIVTLTEDPISFDQEKYHLNNIFFPISDMGIPTPRKAFEICSEIVSLIENGEKIYIHCKAGLGRTGTILSCCLVNMGRSSDDAIKEIRQINNAYIQTYVQEKFISHYYNFFIQNR